MSFSQEQWLAPPRSADLTPQHFFLWGHLKNNLHTLEELRTTLRLRLPASVYIQVLHKVASNKGSHYWTGSPFRACCKDMVWFGCRDVNHICDVCLVVCALSQYCLKWCARLFDHSVQVLYCGARGSVGLRHYAASRKVVGSSPDEWIFLNWHNPWPHYGPGVDSASNRNEYQ
jgi:hypothetical protein